MLEKIDEAQNATVRVSYKYGLGVEIDGEEEIVKQMKKQVESGVKPERIVFKKQPTEVYLYKLALKDSIWFMWENKCEEGPPALV